MRPVTVEESAAALLQTGAAALLSSVDCARLQFTDHVNIMVDLAGPIDGRLHLALCIKEQLGYLTAFKQSGT